MQGRLEAENLQVSVKSGPPQPTSVEPTTKAPPHRRSREDLTDLLASRSVHAAAPI